MTRREQRELFRAAVEADPQSVMASILSSLADGGSLRNWCTLNNYRLAQVEAWIKEDDGRRDSVAACNGTPTGGYRRPECRTKEQPPPQVAQPSEPVEQKPRMKIKDANLDIAEVCEAASCYSLKDVAAQFNVNITALMRWIKDDHERIGLYKAAREARAHLSADKVQELAIAVERGSIPPDAARVAIAAHQWVAAKLNRQDYGEKIDSEIVHSVQNLTDEQLIERARVLSQRVGEFAVQHALVEK